MASNVEVIDLLSSSPPLAGGAAASDDDCIVLEGGASGGARAPRPRKRPRTAPLEADEVVFLDDSPPLGGGARGAPGRRDRRDLAARSQLRQHETSDREMALRLQQEEHQRAEQASLAAARQMQEVRGGGGGGGGERERRQHRGRFAHYDDDSDDDEFAGGGYAPAPWARFGGGGGAPRFAARDEAAQQLARLVAQTGGGRGRGFGGLLAHMMGGVGALGGALGRGGGLPGPGGLPLGVALSDRDFGPDDYESLLALDERVTQRGTSKAALAANTTVSRVAAAAAEGGGAEACAVCLDAPQPGDTVRRLACFHSFHQACIDPWLAKSRTCPVCKHLVGEA